MSRNCPKPKKYKRKHCKNICQLPSWVYCSDECGNLARQGK